MGTEIQLQITGGSGNYIDGNIVGNSAFRQTITLGDPGGTANILPIGQTQGAKVWLGADGVSIFNFPAGFNVNNSPTIANTGFGASITNFPTVQVVGITNVASVGITNIVGISINQTVAVRDDISSLTNGTVAFGTSQITISLGAAGDNLIVAGLSGRQYYIMQYTLTEGVSNILKWKYGISSDMSGNMPLGAPAGIASPYVPIGILRTGLSGGIILNLQAGGSVGGHLIYGII